MSITNTVKRSAKGAVRTFASDVKAEIMEIPKSAKNQVVPELRKEVDKPQTTDSGASKIFFTPKLSGFDVTKQVKSDLKGAPSYALQQATGGALGLNPNSQAITPKGEAMSVAHSIVGQITGSGSKAPIVNAMLQPSTSTGGSTAPRTPPNIDTEIEGERRKREELEKDWKQKQAKIMQGIDQKNVSQPGAPILPGSPVSGAGAPQGKAKGIESGKRMKKN